MTKSTQQLPVRHTPIGKPPNHDNNKGIKKILKSIADWAVSTSTPTRETSSNSASPPDYNLRLSFFDIWKPSVVWLLLSAAAVLFVGVHFTKPAPHNNWLVFLPLVPLIQFYRVWWPWHDNVIHASMENGRLTSPDVRKSWLFIRGSEADDVNLLNAVIATPRIESWLRSVLDVGTIEFTLEGKTVVLRNVKHPGKIRDIWLALQLQQKVGRKQATDDQKLHSQKTLHLQEESLVQIKGLREDIRELHEILRGSVVKGSADDLAAQQEKPFEADGLQADIQRLREMLLAPVVDNNKPKRRPSRSSWQSQPPRRRSTRK